jgi:hypothetical protein
LLQLILLQNDARAPGRPGQPAQSLLP